MENHPAGYKGEARPLEKPRFRRWWPRLSGLTRIKVRLIRFLRKNKRAKSSKDVEINEDTKKNILTILHNPKNLLALEQILLQQEVDPTTPDRLGNSPLHSVALRPFSKRNEREKSDYAYMFLVKSTVDVNSLNPDGNSALHFAAEINDMQLAKVLLVFGANVNVTNKRGRTPIDMCFNDSNNNLETLFSEPPDTTSTKKKHDNVRKLLEECGGVSGRKRETIHLCTPKRTATKVFRRATTIRKRDSGSTKQEPISEHCVRERSSLESDWCLEVAKLYHRIWTIARIYPAPKFSADLKDAAQLGSQVRMMRLLQMAGSRILTLDGGGMKGLMEVELLEQIENATGRKIVELFDWIVGTSVGAFVAAGLVYAKLSVKEIRQFFYTIKDTVLGDNTFRIAYNTSKLVKVLKEIYGDKTMSAETYPRVIITAVNKKTTNLKIEYFGNHPDIDEDYENRPIWKVLRYTSAGPTYFEELDGYVDGGVLANNPSSCALTFIQEMYSRKGMKLPISLMVSVGTGIRPENELGCVDAQEILMFNTHWLNSADNFLSRAANLKNLLSIAITESESVAINVQSRCKEQGIDFYRFSPHLQDTIYTQETRKEILFDYVLAARKCKETKRSIANLMLRFPLYADANHALHDMIDNGLELQF